MFENLFYVLISEKSILNLIFVQNFWFVLFSLKTMLWVVVPSVIMISVLKLLWVLVFFYESQVIHSEAKPTGAVVMIMPAISSGPNGEMKPDCSLTASPTARTECAGCGTLIMDRYYLSAVDRQWHIHCLKCSQCKIALDSELTCFSREGHIYCKEDYYR